MSGFFLTNSILKHNLITLANTASASYNIKHHSSMTSKANELQVLNSWFIFHLAAVDHADAEIFVKRENREVSCVFWLSNERALCDAIARSFCNLRIALIAATTGARPMLAVENDLVVLIQPSQYRQRPYSNPWKMTERPGAHLVSRWGLLTRWRADRPALSAKYFIRRSQPDIERFTNDVVLTTEVCFDAGCAAAVGNEVLSRL